MNALLYSVLILFLASFLGSVFVSPGFWLLGMVGFILMMIAGTSRHGFKQQKIRLKKVWMIAAPLFILCFFTYWLLTEGSGGPEIKELPVFAKRETYQFIRLGEVSRLRFVAASLAWTLGWHLFASVFCLELIAANQSAHTTPASAPR